MNARRLIETLIEGAPAPAAPPKPTTKPQPGKAPAPSPSTPQPQRYDNPWRRKRFAPGEKTTPKAFARQPGRPTAESRQPVRARDLI